MKLITAARLREIADELASVVDAEAAQCGNRAAPEHTAMIDELRAHADWLEARPIFNGECPTCGQKGRTE